VPPDIPGKMSGIKTNVIKIGKIALALLGIEIENVILL
jgi:hypothetical protein